MCLLWAANKKHCSALTYLQPESRNLRSCTPASMYVGTQGWVGRYAILIMVSSKHAVRWVGMRFRNGKHAGGTDSPRLSGPSCPTHEWQPLLAVTKRTAGGAAQQPAYCCCCHAQSLLPSEQEHYSLLLMVILSMMDPMLKMKACCQKQGQSWLIPCCQRLGRGGALSRPLPAQGTRPGLPALGALAHRGLHQLGPRRGSSAGTAGR
jgi:hypothetical protein